MNLLGSEDTLNRLAKANGARWHGHVLRRDSDDIKALNFEVIKRRRRGRSR